jgi:hypothetical protein
MPEKIPEGREAKPSSPRFSGLVSSGVSPKTAPSPQILFEHLARSLNIPQDALSSRLLSFLRYFSLPLEGEQIAQLRREVLASRMAGAPKNREAAALGAAAAADKGIVLSPEALAEYAAAIDPEERPPGDRGFNGEQGHPSGQEHPEGGEKKKRDRPGSGEDQEAPAETRTLRKKIETLPQHHPLLSLLNRLPGKNGRHWMVFPFNFTSGGVAFEVSLRILLTNTENAREKAHLTLDILGGKGRWVFCLSGYGTAHSRADIGVSPSLPRRVLKTLERELGELLGDFAERICVENQETPFWAEGANRGFPLPVNKKV